MKAKKVLVRLGFSDVILTQEEAENTNGHVTLYDNNGKVIGSTDTFFVGYEDEEGNECDENGDLLI